MDPVEEIKGRLSIEDIVGRYVDLKRSGASYKGLCPFHQEKTPSFYVTPSRGTYHCFGCGVGGDLFSFVMGMERVDFREALRRLADQAGVSLPEREPPGQPSLRARLYEANAATARFYRRMIEDASQAWEYLSGRGFGAEALDLFEIGLAPEGGHSLLTYLRGQGFEDRILLEAGLVLQDSIGGQLRDRFRGRLMFPIRDTAGRVTGFGGRAMGNAEPKYLNSPQTDIFDKSAVLFGIHRAQDAIRSARRAVLVEGYLDAVRAHTSGYLNVVASLGTAVTTQQLLSLARITDTVILALDPDPAGQSAASRTSLNALVEVTQSRGRASGAAAALDLRIARLPEDQGDPDELIRDQPALWDAAIEASVPAFDFFFQQTMDSLDRATPAWRQDAIDRLLPMIQTFRGSAGWQAVWIERLASETGLDPRVLRGAVPGGRPRRRSGQPNEYAQSVVAQTTARSLAADTAADIENALVGLLLHIVVVPAEAARLVRDVEFRDPQNRAIVDALLVWQESGSYEYEAFRESLPETLRSRADALRTPEAPLPEEEKVTVAVAFHLARLRQFRLRSDLRRATETLQTLAPEDQRIAADQIGSLHRAELEIERALDELSRQAVQASTADYGTMDQDSGRL